jgi:SNF2 family DNA or RNA helicase
MRTGKTKVVLDEFGELWDADKARDLFVTAPAGVYGTWITAVEEHIGEPLASLLRVHLWSSSDGAEKNRKLESFMAYEGPRLLLVNTEAFSMVKRAKMLAHTFVKQRGAYVAVDESTAIKNPSAKRTKFMVEHIAPYANYRRILTGLVSPRSPLDLYSQFEFLDQKILGFSSYWTFRARYAVIKKMTVAGRSFDNIVGYRDVEELNLRIAPHSYRVRLEDCYDLPPKIYDIREVSLTDEQKRIYQDLKAFATTKLANEAHVTTTMVITQILRLHQVLCGHVTDEEGNVHEIPSNRTSELLELLEEHEGKAIIWCSYDIDIRRVSEALTKAYGEGSVARFWGGNRNTREQEEARFLNDPACLFMVATPAAGGRGRTWMNADLVVYYSNTDNLEHREQSEERPQGVDKINSVLYVDLLARRTVEEKILHSLRKKIDMAAVISGDQWREWIV